MTRRHCVADFAIVVLCAAGALAVRPSGAGPALIRSEARALAAVEVDAAADVAETGAVLATISGKDEDVRASSVSVELPTIPDGLNAPAQALLRVGGSHTTTGAPGSSQQQSTQLHWLEVLVGASAAALIVLVSGCLSRSLATGLPLCGRTDAEKLRAQVKATRDKTLALEEALALAVDAEALSAPAATAAASSVGVDSREQLVGEMLVRTRDFEQTVAEGTKNAVAHAAPLVARATMAAGVLQEGISGIRAKVEKLATDEVGDLAVRVQETLGVEAPEVPDWMRTDVPDAPSAPPIGLLIAGLLAPAQLRLMETQSRGNMLWRSIVVAASVGILIADYGHQCSDNLVWIWLFGMLATSALELLASAVTLRRAATALEEIAVEQERKGRLPPSGNAIWDAFAAVEADSGLFFKGLLRYDAILSSKSHAIAKTMNVLALVFGFFGTYVSIANVVEDTVKCDTGAVLFFMHAYSFIFILFLTWTAVGVTLYLIQKLAGSPWVTEPLLQAAKSLDDELPLKMPFFLTLVRALVLRDSCDMLQLKSTEVKITIRKLEQEKVAAQARQSAADAEIAALKRQAAELSAKEQSARVTERELIDKYTEATAQTLSRAKPLVALVSAHLEVAAPGADPGAGSSTAGSTGLERVGAGLESGLGTVGAGLERMGASLGAGSSTAGSSTAGSTLPVDLLVHQLGDRPAGAPA